MSDIDAARVMIEHRGRIREVTDVLARYGLAEAADAVGDDEPRLRWVRDIAPSRVSPEIAAMSPGERIRAALGELGTAWIKLGQTLSTRPDVVGPQIAAELSGLQSDAPPTPRGRLSRPSRASSGRPWRRCTGRSTGR